MSLVDETRGPAAYRVLARKYRPSRFADLIGQDAMVRTLSNAFDSGRIHQAYLLSGVRGVGKTTTARIVARALNYHRAARDGLAAIDRPTVAMDGLGTHCQAIIESRHVDVIEMDAASHTGIDDVRELIEGARYRPVLARHKVYIIDEVHMLSKQAFNGLLKTLEEPPEHVKFLFATTEADKVPVTVRSRCQRFDLRRIETPVLVGHLAAICAAEGVTVTPDALSLIARAAEGSVRDALSLLDQALATSGDVGEADIRAMLGLADRGLVIDLFDGVMRGAIADALVGLKALYDQGADPLSVVTDLADFVHLVTRLKLVPDAAKDPGLTADERDRGLAFAGALGLPVLTRAWQMLLKGLGDVKESPRPLAAAEMVLVRLAFAADLPTPDEALRQLAGKADNAEPITPGPARAVPLPPAPRAGGSPLVAASRAGTAALAAVARPVAPEAPSLPRARNFADVVALAAAKRDIALKTALERDVRIVRFEEGSIEFELAPGGSPSLAATLMRKLSEWTGQRWMVAITAAGGAATVKETAEAAAEAERAAAAADPIVQAILARFPGATLTVTAIEDTVTAIEPEPPVAAAGPDGDDIGYAEDVTDDDL